MKIEVYTVLSFKHCYFLEQLKLEFINLFTKKKKKNDPMLFDLLKIFQSNPFKVFEENSTNI